MLNVNRLLKQPPTDFGLKIQRQKASQIVPLFSDPGKKGTLFGAWTIFRGATKKDEKGCH